MDSLTLYDALYDAHDSDSLEALLKNKGNQESLNIEWKTSTRELVATMKTLCAFLNNKGGIVLIGVKDSGAIIGQEVSDSTKRDIANELQKFEPYPHINISYIDIEKTKFVIKLTADPEQMAVPYIYDGRAYDRYESSTKIMLQRRYEELLQNKIAKTSPWDKLPARSIDLSALDQHLIFKIWNMGIERGRVAQDIEARSPETILKRLKLFTADNVLTNAAVILFCKDMPAAYLNAEIKLGAFNSITKDNIIDSKIVNGNLFQLLDEASRFIRRNTAISSYFPFNQFERIDQPAYSFDALREAIINALCHRDYTMTGSVSVMFYKDRLEVSSCGSLPFGLTVDKLESNEESFPRNELIASVLYFCGEIEKFGRGIQKILALSRAAGMATPSFQEKSHTFKVIFTPLEPLPIIKEREQVEAQFNALSERQRNILILLKEYKAMSSSQLVNNLVDVSERTVRRDLNILEEEGFVERQGKGSALLWHLAKNFPFLN